MNKDRVLEIADDIERADKDMPEFNMLEFFQWGMYYEVLPGNETNWCGTSACIAGLISVTKFGKYNFDMCVSHSFRAREWLDIDYEESRHLFYGLGSISELEDITKEEAVVCLRHFAKTGKVDWERAQRAVAL